jgi:hypothetical protein
MRRLGNPPLRSERGEFFGHEEKLAMQPVIPALLSAWEVASII